MAGTPNFEQLKDACGSGELHHAFQFLFLQEEAENDGFIMLLGEKCDDVRRRMDKRRELLEEGENFSPMDPVAGDGLECIEEAQEKDDEILAALIVVLDLAREARVEKRAHVAKMEKYN